MVSKLHLAFPPMLHAESELIRGVRTVSPQSRRLGARGVLLLLLGAVTLNEAEDDESENGDSTASGLE